MTRTTEELLKDVDKQVYILEKYEAGVKGKATVMRDDAKKKLERNALKNTRLIAELSAKLGEAEDKISAGDRIRIQKYMYDTPTHQDDYTIEKFRHCLGVFLSEEDRAASKFTPLCDLYEPAPDAEKGYIGNYGEYWDKWVQGWMDLPLPTPPKEK